MLKFENQFSVGDRIKAFDFKPVDHPDYPDRYIVGTIMNAGFFNGYKAFEIVVEQEAPSIEAKYSRIGDRVLVPMGIMGSDYDGRVSLAGE